MDSAAEPTPMQPAVVWLTGYSGAGKTTIALVLKALLDAESTPAIVLDGDVIRRGLNRDLGFSEGDRAENIRRVAELARLLVDAGQIAIVALISPMRGDRDAARARFAPSQFVEVFVDTPLEVAEARDVKGLYRRARAGDLPNFTGVSSPYEAPQCPELHVDTTAESAHAAAARIANYMRQRCRDVAAPATPECVASAVTTFVR